ncbi:MAG: hypothetical protein M1491_06020 [Deltaproteobacteria bacterium]|nr:hypothetical protein [Deltaproteobacteria bacterium]
MALIPKVIMELIEQKERVFDTAKGNTSGLPAMLPWYSAWTASLSLWKYGDVMGRTPLYRKELCFTSGGENSFFMITKGRGTRKFKAVCLNGSYIFL